MPLTLTILSSAVPAEKRGLALGAWGGISGLAVAFGPLVGGAVVNGISWNWIFWLNVPFGLLLIPLALRQLDESYGPAQRLDLRGLVLASGGLFGIVWGLVRGNEVGWGSAQIVGSLVTGTAVLAAFVASELRASEPMLPMRFFRNRTFSLANAASLFMSFGMFGAIFLLAQFFQTVQGYSPLASGVRILPWTVMPMFVAPVTTPTTPYWELVGPFSISGIGMALFFAPVANVVLSAVRPEEQGQASGANNAVRELGGVFGVAVLAAVFSAYGGYGTGEHFVAGMNPAVWIGAGVVALGSLAAFAIGKRPRAQEEHAREEQHLEPAYEA